MAAKKQGDKYVFTQDWSAPHEPDAPETTKFPKGYVVAPEELSDDFDALVTSGVLIPETTTPPKPEQAQNAPTPPAVPQATTVIHKRSGTVTATWE